MASRWKTFASNSTLPASDLNDCINPSTADHIARAVATGSVAINPITAGAAVAVDIQFPAGRFSTAPFVFMTTATSVPNQCSVSVGTRTTTGCTIYGTRTSGTAGFNVHWFAVEV